MGLITSHVRCRWTYGWMYVSVCQSEKPIFSPLNLLHFLSFIFFLPSVLFSSSSISMVLIFPPCRWMDGWTDALLYKSCPPFPSVSFSWRGYLGVRKDVEYRYYLPGLICWRRRSGCVFPIPLLFHSLFLTSSFFFTYSFLFIHSPLSLSLSLISSTLINFKGL